MHKLLKNFFLLTALVLQTACDAEPPNTSANGNLSGDTYLTFGHFFGECFGEACVETFKIEGGEVFEDTLDNYPVQHSLPQAMAFIKLPENPYDEVKQLFDLVPEELFVESNIVIGQPDAGDWGGFYLETNMRGEPRVWLIDKLKNNLPAYLHPFTDSLDATIQRLQQELSS